MKALIDGDILRYEIGFAAETGWKAIRERDEIPPFNYIEDLLLQRIANIQALTETDECVIYLTEGRTFRFDVAKTKPYKGTRIEKKPWHFNNLSAYIKGTLPHKVVTGIEADDALAIDAINNGDIVCSRDKDLRQVPSWFFSWELGNQASFGPLKISDAGYVELADDKKKLNGTGFAFFCGQMLTGDRVDNIPGYPKVGPVAAYELLKDIEHKDEMLQVVVDKYRELGDNWKDYFYEQGNLLWIVRKLDENNKPIMFESEFDYVD